jgi:hypothetical protein
MPVRPTSHVVLLLLLALTGGAGASLPGDGCEDGCPCDDSAGHCLPGCADCACCPAPRTIQAAAAGVEPALDPAGDADQPRAGATCAGDPREVFHVPRAAR